MDLKANIINLVKYHKEHCDGTCGCSLHFVGALLIQAGYTITDEEVSLFM